MPLNRVTQEEFRIGEQRDFAPHLMDPRSVYTALNSLLDDDGSIYKRGGSQKLSNAAFGTSLRDVWEGYLVPGRRTLIASTTGFGVIAEDGATPISLGGSGFGGAPKPMVAVQDLLFIGGGTIYGGSRKAADYSAGTITLTPGSPIITGVGTAFAKNVDAGMLFRLTSSDRIYVVKAVDSDTELTLRDPYELLGFDDLPYSLKGETDCSANPKYPAAVAGAMYRVSKAGKIGGEAGTAVNVGDIFVCIVKESAEGTQAEVGTHWTILAANASYTLKRLETASAPYRVSDLYSTVGKRLVVCEGNVIRFTEPDKPHLWEATIPPNEAVVANLHELEEGINILGVDSVGADRLMVFHTRGLSAVSGMSLSIVDGLGNPQHRIEKVAGTLLWGNGVGIAAYSGSLVVPTIDDIYMMDGTSEETGLAQSIVPLYRQRIQEGFTPGNAFVYHNHYFLPILDPSGVPQDLFVCRLDRPIFMGRHIPFRWPWTVMSGSGARISGGMARPAGSSGDAPRALAACSDGFLIDLHSFFEPSAAVKNDHDGTTALWTVVTRDYAAGSLAIGRFRRLVLIYEMEAAVGDTPLISAEIGLGVRKGVLPTWDDVTWDDFEWADPEETEFDVLDGEAVPNAGNASVLAQNAWAWYLGKTARYTRYRIQCADPVAKLSLRSLEIFVAQPGGVRKTKVR